MKTVHIIISFCIGLLLGHLLFNNTKEITKYKLLESANIFHKSAQVDLTLKAQHRFLIERNKGLVKQLKATDQLLLHSEKKLSEQRSRLLAVTENGSNNGNLICFEKDSLINAITQLHMATDTVLYFHTRKIEFADSLVAVRDSQVVACNRAYQQIKGLVNEQVIRENKLREELNTILKQQKRKRLQNKFMAAGMLLVSGIATSLIVKSRQ
jgi:hypothetical protein